MLLQKKEPSPIEIYLQPPEGQRYVRSFLFSRHINAPFARVHLIARALFIFSLSLVQLRAIDTLHPDLVAALLWWVVALVMLWLSGISKRVAHIYLLISIPALFSLLTTWLIFNPVEGKVLLLRLPVYSGQLALGVSLWQLAWLAIAGGYFFWTRKFAPGILLATVVAIVLARLVPLPSWTWMEVGFFHPLTILVSDRGLLVAITKVIGYSSMMLATIVLVISSRDVELIGTLRQLRLPQPIIFFLALVFRSLDLGLSDFETVRQAQRARAIDALPRSIFRRIRDLGSLSVPLIAIMIRRSSEMGDALIARGFKLTKSGTDFYESSPWRLVDWVFLVISLGLLYLALWQYVNLTDLFLQWR